MLIQAPGADISYLYIRMKIKNIFCALFFLLGITGHSQTIIPGGFVSGTWDSAGSPYLLQGSVSIHRDSALFVQAGVEVEMQSKYSGMLVQGHLQVVGTAAAPVLFHGQAWYGITLDSAASLQGDSLRFEYCTISGGEDFSVQATGGAMDIRYTDSVSLNHCLFSGNWVKDWGGALFLYHSHVLIRNTTFSSNRAGSGNYGDGGALAMVHSSPVLTNVSFEGNQANVAGAVYAVHSSPAFYYCTFTDNSCDMGNAGALYCADSGYVAVRNCFFDRNTSPEKGGAVYLEGMEARIESSIFSNNQTTDGTGSSKGGALHVKNGEYVLLGLEFRKNQALVGGALYTDNASLTMNLCDFVDNTSFAGGGAMVSHKSGVITLDECLFQNNRAGGSGGAVALLEAMWARFRYCTFLNNISSSDEYLSDGGGVMVTPYDNYAFFINCVFTGNVAEDYGGGAYLTSITQVAGCLFNDNMAGTDSLSDAGGGAMALAEAAFPILNCTFSGNSGGPGTTIYCEDAQFTLLNSILYDDHSDPDPKIFMSTVEEAPTAYIDHCNIEGGNGIIRGTGPYVVEWATGNISADPLFEMPGEDFRLTDESPCIDTARSDTLVLLLPAKDLDKNTRIYRDEIDMGCYENQTHFGIPEHVRQMSLIVYPNPARGDVYLQSSLPEKISGDLLITDISGRTVSTQKVSLLPGSRIKYPVSNLQSGLYLIILKSASEVYSAKLVVRR